MIVDSQRSTFGNIDCWDFHRKAKKNSNRDNDRLTTQSGFIKCCWDFWWSVPSRDTQGRFEHHIGRSQSKSLNSTRYGDSKSRTATDWHIEANRDKLLMCFWYSRDYVRSAGEIIHFDIFRRLYLEWIHISQSCPRGTGT
jgi:hypothetical protein